MGIEHKLQAPFPTEDIEFKPQTSGVSANGNAYVLVVPYVTNRAIQKRLDDVFGVFGWSNEFTPSTTEKGYLCGITINLDGKTATKWDGAESTKIEPLKGGLSNSMKRAAVQFGIGRYLYDLPEFFAQCVVCGKQSRHEFGNVIRGKGNNPNIAWKTPTLPDWALPIFDFSEYESRINHAKSIDELKEAFAEAWNAAKVNANKEGMDKKFKAMYDIKKKEIESKAAENVKKDTNEIMGWIESLAGQFAYVPNAEAVNTLFSSYASTLDEKCLGTFVDKNLLHKRLKEIHQKRINQLLEKEKIQ